MFIDELSETFDLEQSLVTDEDIQEAPDVSHLLEVMELEAEPIFEPEPLPAVEPVVELPEPQMVIDDRPPPVRRPEPTAVPASSKAAVFKLA